MKILTLLQRSPPPHLCGVACYTGVEIRSGRTPLSLCTAAWRLSSATCCQEDESKVASETKDVPTVPPPVPPLAPVQSVPPPVAERLEFSSAWRLYGNVDDEPLPLLRAMRLCAERFAACVAAVVAEDTAVSTGRGIRLATGLG